MQAAEPSNATDYRIYGYLTMSDTNCPQSVIGVCEELLLLRMSSTDITLAPSKTPPLGKYMNRTIGCPSAHGTWEGATVAVGGRPNGRAARPRPQHCCT